MNAPVDFTRSPNRRATVAAVVVLLLATTFQFSMVNRPFERSAEGCGAFFGLLARNYFRYPLAVSHAIPIMSNGETAPPVFYANHPPTTPLLIAGVMAASGYRGEYDRLPATWTIRLPTVLATLGCGWLIFILVKNRVGGRAAVMAAAIFLSLPMSLMYGGFPDVISPQLCVGILLTLAAYEHITESPTWKNCAMLCVAFASAGVIDWPAFYLLPVLAIHCLCTQPIRRWPVFIAFGLFGTALFFAEYAYLTTAQPDWRWMISQLLKRSAGHEGDYTGTFTFAQWCKQALGLYAIGRHTAIVVLLALFWIFGATVNRFRGPGQRFIGLLLGWAALHVLIGRQGVYQHEWWWWPLSPGVAMAAAMALETIVQFMAKRIAITVATLIAAGALAALAACNAITITNERNEPSLIEPNHQRGSVPGPLNYSLVELGEVVRQNVPARSVYLITEDDLSLASWYYSDRAARRHVWDVNTFEIRKKLPGIDLSFDLYTEWNAPASRMIVPKIYASYVPMLLQSLDSRFTRIDLPKFIIFDLTRPK